MKKINLAITGCMGRMGQQLIKTTKKKDEKKILDSFFRRIVKGVLKIDMATQSLTTTYGQWILAHAQSLH